MEELIKKIEKESGRKVALASLVGSHNYNLNTETSDKDYKFFAFPTFEDLYKNTKYVKSIVSDSVDYTVHDIRELPKLLWKGNINFLEVLVSQEMYVDESLQGVLNRDDFLVMNKGVFFDACRGTAKQKISKLHKYSENNQFMEEKFGYNTKEACHALRVLWTLENYELLEFKDFKSAIYFDVGDCSRDILLAIKSGHYTEKEFMNIYNQYEKDSLNYKDEFYSIKPNIKAYNELDNIIYQAVKKNLVI